MSDIVEKGFNTIMAPQTFDEAWRYAKCISESDLAPKDYKEKPANCLVAMQMGAEIGLQPMAALQNIAVINGRPSIWGDAQLAVCLPHLSEFSESFDATAMKAKCIGVRNGRRVIEEFSVEDAKTAKLWGKPGPWQTYPKRMLKMRARGYVLRDLCPDILKGISSAEEQTDVIRIENEHTSPVAIEDAAVKEEVKAPEPTLIKEHEQFKVMKAILEEKGIEEDLNKAMSAEEGYENESIKKFNSAFDWARKHPGKGEG